MGSRKRHLAPLEILTLAHVAVLLIGGSWVLGGNAWWVRHLLSWWGTFGALITLTAVLRDWRDDRPNLRPFLWLWPFVVFNALVLLSCLTPSYREVHFGSQSFLTPIDVPAWPPSTARPDHALRDLWLFDAIWISCFNLALLIRRRRTLRGLLIAMALNGIALAVFGSVQELMGSTGLYFGAVDTGKQPFFFASFFYHNHWGAFALEMIAVCIGLGWHYLRRKGSDRLLQSPALVGLLGVVLIAITEPLSASRSCTLMLVPLLGGALGHWLIWITRQRRQLHESVAVPVLATCLAAVVALGAIWYVARDVILNRLATTQLQLADMHAEGGIGSRGVLYRDTWHMAKDRIWFGWGMASYPTVFSRYNTQQVSRVDGLTTYYVDAHNDWLQSLAEHGIVGTGLLVLCPLAALWAMRGKSWGVLPLYLLGGCLLIVCYSIMEFPLDNTGVVIFWWACFFIAVQYIRLSDRPADRPAEQPPEA
jgi:O-antigen ligase